MNELMIWDFQGAEVRTVNIDGQSWWVLVDVCKALEISHVKDTVQRLEEDEVGQTEVIDSLGRKQLSWVVNESGLYAVILRSDKPKAKPFRRWVTHEVLPAIREHGYYVADSVIEESRPTTAILPSDYLKIADIIARCKTERLQLVIEVLNKGGYDIPDRQKLIQQDKENESCYEYILAQVTANEDKFDDAASEQWGKYSYGGAAVYIVKRVLDRLCAQGGYNAKSFVSWAREHNKLICSPNGDYGRAARLGNSVVTRCVCLKLDTEDCTVSVAL